MSPRLTGSGDTPLSYIAMLGDLAERLVALLLVALSNTLDLLGDGASWEVSLLVEEAAHRGEVCVSDDAALLALASSDDVLAVAIAEGVAAHEHHGEATAFELVAGLGELSVLLIRGPAAGAPQVSDEPDGERVLNRPEEQPWTTSGTSRRWNSIERRRAVAVLHQKLVDGSSLPSLHACQSDNTQPGQPPAVPGLACLVDLTRISMWISRMFHNDHSMVHGLATRQWARTHMYR